VRVRVRVRPAGELLRQRPLILSPNPNPAMEQYTRPEHFQ